MSSDLVCHWMCLFLHCWKKGLRFLLIRCQWSRHTHQTNACKVHIHGITNGSPQVLKLFQNKSFTCEYKYDGQRAQIHKLADGSVRVFSRNGDETTSRFPDLTQSLILPMLLSSMAVLCFHLPISWALIFKLELGNIGAGIAFSISTWLYVLFLAFYIKFSSSCEKTRVPFSLDAFLGISHFFRFPVPSAVMVCLTISTLHFTIPYAFGAAASTRVSNELGAGNPQKARLAVQVVMFLAAIETVVLSASLFGSRHILGKAFSSEKQVVDYIAAMTPLFMFVHCHRQFTSSHLWLVRSIHLRHFRYSKGKWLAAHWCIY